MELLIVQLLSSNANAFPQKEVIFFFFNNREQLKLFFHYVPLPLQLLRDTTMCNSMESQLK